MSGNFQKLPSSSDAQKKIKTNSEVWKYIGLFLHYLWKMLRALKYVIFFVVTIMWIVCFIIAGVLLRRQSTIVGNKQSIALFVIGSIPVLIIVIYILQRIYTAKQKKQQ